MMSYFNCNFRKANHDIERKGGKSLLHILLKGGEDLTNFFHHFFFGLSLLPLTQLLALAEKRLHEALLNQTHNLNKLYNGRQTDYLAC